MLTEVTNAVQDTGDRTQGGVATAGVADAFAPDTILLAREGQGDKGHGVELRQGAGCGVNGGVTSPQGDVAEAEKVITGARGASVLPWAEEEVEGEGGTVGGSVESRTPIVMGERHDRAEERQG